MFVLLTFSRLLVSRKCVLFPHRPCLSCSLFLAFSSLGSMCFAFPLYSQLHSFPPPIPIQIVRPFIPSITTHITFSACSLTERFGIRAFFKYGTTVNHSLFH
ncbi:hypothetical protein DFH08DRAFT_100886 [Mycena albidolilacea]|uniref:Uncharacterized protein n=1 Tax=Mycena albidolilacea TaxID=1033008 RepID=A0AAD7A801_9AGAR|nr:hypothetical protein DFH08DRAFT_100886 [Mycena albidolilacea]